MYDTDAAAAQAAITEWRNGHEVETVGREAKKAAVIAYGKALLAGRDKHPGNAAFSKWVTDNRLDEEPFRNVRERSDAMQLSRVFRNGPEDARLADCPYTTPSDMMTWAREQGFEEEPERLPPVVITGDNLAAAVFEFARDRLKLDLDNPSWEKVRRGQVELLFTKGTEHIRQMCFHGRGGVGLDSAYQFVRDKTADEQEAATIHDVRGYGERVRQGRQAELERPKRGEKKARLDSLRAQRNQAAIDSALRRAAKPRVTEEEFERPPPELIDQQYPGREPGVTYASVHLEQHGHVWHNVAQKRRTDLVIKIGKALTGLSEDMAKISILDDRERANVMRRWRRAIAPYRQEILNPDESAEALT